MNEQNLIPNKDRTPSELREITSKGGKASGIARRKRKAVKQAILDAIYSETESGNLVLDDMIAGMIKRVKRMGDPAAWEKIMEYADMSPERKRMDAELDLKKSQVEKKDSVDIEDLSRIWGSVNEPDTDD